MSAQKDQTAKFRALHAKGNILILANAWDAGSARLLEDAGAPAIATTSAAVAWSHGFPDGEALPVDVLLRTVAEIVRSVKIPVSVDSEEGFSENPAKVADYVLKLIERGVVGMNLEDGRGSVDLMEAKIAAIKQAVAKKGADFFINARTDVYLKKLTAPEAALDETLMRGARYKKAGADGYFVPFLADLVSFRTIAAKVDLPINAIVVPQLASVAELKAAGVRRVSAGAGIGRAALGAARRAAKEILELGKYDAMFASVEGLPNMNALFAK
ncbi:MAG: isocitrate lyase/phosphoenolpyruvate mutase family protein [Proteobacteria bacterium]|nr:isocitrate lyase/phosphoenolpyruvate mutase family protein [Pseudomonadota bacterium]